MAKSNAVWGIDIGQCALKALRCRPGDDSDHVVADAFDYIEYPKILSQPEADPAELIRDALELFLSRNSVRGDRVAISVSGQSGLARFIKLPPVQSRKIPDIVKYEARQQIPFALEDVVWDYQQMVGGSEEEGFALETEVGLFAMKRDQVYRALKPFDDAGIEIDIIQLTPLAIYNYTVFDQLQELPPPEEYDPDTPPESLVVLSLGTEATDLVITNGYRVWQRSIPLGGSHFTKALSKELRLTFAKAEHLKRNATQAEDRKAVFQAMRQVFHDLLTDIQRSIGYFTSIDRKARIGRVVALGNAMKLQGLQRYLSQNLGYTVAEVESYRGLTGSAVVNSPVFKENLLSFAVCYGLALQGLGNAKLSTNLLPREIVTDRLIRDKKPWAVALVASLMMGCAVSFLGHWNARRSVHEQRFQSGQSAADAVQGEARQLAEDYNGRKTKFTDIDKMGQNIVGNVEGRLLWLELLKAINHSLPRDDGNQPRPEEITQRQELHIEDIECERFTDLNRWYQGPIAGYIKEARQRGGAPAAAPTPPQPAMDENGMPVEGGAPGEPGPTGEGWVIQLTGHHYHNNVGSVQGADYVRETLIRQLEEGKVPLPVGPNKQMQDVPIKSLGVQFPVLVYTPRIHDVEIKLPVGQEGNPDNAEGIRKPRFDFIVQFCWQETPLSKRLEKQRALQQQQAAAGDSVAASGANP